MFVTVMIGTLAQVLDSDLLIFLSPPKYFGGSIVAAAGGYDMALSRPFRITRCTAHLCVIAELRPPEGDDVVSSIRPTVEWSTAGPAPGRRNISGGPEG